MSTERPLLFHCHPPLAGCTGLQRIRAPACSTLCPLPGSQDEDFAQGTKSGFSLAQACLIQSPVCLILSEVTSLQGRSSV